MGMGTHKRARESPSKYTILHDDRDDETRHSEAEVSSNTNNVHIGPEHTNNSIRRTVWALQSHKTGVSLWGAQNIYMYIYLFILL